MENSVLENVNIELSNKVFCDYTNTGDTNIICPICHEKPTYRESRDNNGRLSRASVACKCGHILNGEIYL